MALKKILGLRCLVKWAHGFCGISKCLVFLFISSFNLCHVKHSKEDPEVIHDKLPHLDLHCLQMKFSWFHFWFLKKTLSGKIAAQALSLVGSIQDKCSV